MKLRIWSRVRRSKEQWFVSYGRDVLSGPWKTAEEAVQSKMEWKYDN